MTTPRVTEIPLQLAAVERDPFGDVPTGRQATLDRQVKVVREVMRARAVRGRAGPSPRPRD